jgi:hypothetical protein
MHRQHVPTPKYRRVTVRVNPTKTWFDHLTKDDFRVRLFRQALLPRLVVCATRWPTFARTDQARGRNFAQHRQTTHVVRDESVCVLGEDFGAVQ